MERPALRRILLAGLLAAVLGAAAGVGWRAASPARHASAPAGLAAPGGGPERGAAAPARSASRAGTKTKRTPAAADGSAAAVAGDSATTATAPAARDAAAAAALKNQAMRAGTGNAALASAQAKRNAAHNGAAATQAAARAPGAATPAATGAPASAASGDTATAATPTPTPDAGVGAIRGVVLRADGTPTSGALVILTPTDRPDPDTGARQAVSGLAGEFDFEGLPVASSNSLQAHAEGYGDAAAQGIVPTPEGTAVQLILGGTGRLVGSVVRGSDGAPLPAVVVSLGGTAGGLRQTKSDDAGQFNFGLLQTGVYQLAGRMTVPGGTAWICEPLEGLAVQSGGALTVQMRAWPPASVRGAVLDKATQAPVPGTAIQMVRIRPLSGAWGGQSDAGCGGQATSDASGAFAVQGLLAGDYQVYLRNAKYATPSKPEWLTVAEGDAMEGVQFYLEAGGTLTGTVVDGSGQPVGQVPVQIEPRPDPFFEQYPVQLRQVSDATGRFGFQGLLLNREYRVTTTQDAGPGGKPWPFAATDYRLLSDTAPQADLVLSLTAGLAVRGVATDEAGHGVSGVAITVRGPAGSGPWRNGLCGSAITDANGAYGVGGLAPGDYTVTAARAGYEPPADRPVTLSGADAADVNFVLARGAVLHGVLVDLGAQALPGWQVSVTSSDPANPNGQGETVTTAADGSFQLEGLTGAAVLQIMHSIPSGQMIFRSGGITSDGPDSQAVLVVPIGGTLTGQVVDAATAAPVNDFSLDLYLDTTAPPGLPPSGTQCAVVQANFRALSGTGRSGSFATPPLPAGRYTAHLTAPGHVARDVAGVVVPAEGFDLGQVAMTRGANLTGRLVDSATGLPYVPDNSDYGPSHFFAVVAEGAAGDSSGLLQGEIQADGTFSVAGVPAAVVHAYFKVGARLPVDLTNLPPADEAGVVHVGDVRLDWGCTVQGRVTAPDGTPLNRVQVIVACPGHEMPDAIRNIVVWQPNCYYASGLTRADGSFVVRGAFAGPVTAFAVTSPTRYPWAAGHGDPYKSQEAVVNASPTAPVTAVLQFR